MLVWVILILIACLLVLMIVNPRQQRIHTVPRLRPPSPTYCYAFPNPQTLPSRNHRPPEPEVRNRVSPVSRPVISHPPPPTVSDPISSRYRVATERGGFAYKLPKPVPSPSLLPPPQETRFAIPMESEDRPRGKQRPDSHFESSRGSFKPRQQGGGFKSRQQGGGFKSRQQEGGFDSGEFKSRQQEGGFKSRQQGGGFKSRQQEGGFDSGGFKSRQQEGGFKSRQQGGGFKSRQQEGGFDSGGFKSRQQKGRSGDFKNNDRKDTSDNRNPASRRRGQGEFQLNRSKPETSY